MDLILEAHIQGMIDELSEEPAIPLRDASAGMRKLHDRVANAQKEGNPILLVDRDDIGCVKWALGFTAGVLAAVAARRDGA